MGIQNFWTRNKKLLQSQIKWERLQQQALITMYFHGFDIGQRITGNMLEMLGHAAVLEEF